MTDFRARVRASFDRQAWMATLGARLAGIEDGEVRIALPFSPRLSQQHGYLHAGVVTGIVDSACGYAALTQGPDGCEVVSAEFKVNLLRPALGARFVAIGTVRHAGRRLAVCTGEVRAFAGPGDEYKVTALMQATMAYVAGA